MAKKVPVSQRRRGTKNKRGPKGSKNVNVRNTGTQTRTNSSGTTSFPYSGRTSQYGFTFGTQNGNFVDPTDHNWRRRRLICPSPRVELDSGTPSWEIWTGSHPFVDNCYYDMFAINPYENTDLSEQCYAGSLRDRVEKIAYSKFLKELKNSQLALAVDIAESKKSYDMIKRRLDQVISFARRVRRKTFEISRANPNDPTKAPWNIIGSTWLEYKYGWAPLVGSAFGVADALRNRTKYGKFRIKGYYRLNYRPPTLVRKNSSGFSGFTLMEASTKAALSCDFEIRNAWANNASRFIGLNPLGIVWELLPYSFVVDWFVDIGGYLEDLETSFAHGLVFVRGWKSYVHDVSHEIIIPAQIGRQGSRVHKCLETAKGIQKFRDKSRLRLYSVPSPQLPTFDPKLGASRIASGAALLLNILTKFDRRSRFHDFHDPNGFRLK